MPPLDAQTPIEITHLGSGIWSQICRSTGAIFWLTRPATIIRSASRGVDPVFSMPNRAMSCRGPPVCIISIAQQESPNVGGQTERARAQPASFSTEVSRTPLGSFSSIPIVLIPFQAAAAPDVGVRDEHSDDEGDHLDQPEHTELTERHRPGVEKDDLDVEDDEQHRGQVVLDRALPPAERQRRRLDTALVGVEFGLVPALGAGEHTRRFFMGPPRVPEAGPASLIVNPGKNFSKMPDMSFMK